MLKGKGNLHEKGKKVNQKKMTNSPKKKVLLSAGLLLRGGDITIFPSRGEPLAKGEI